MARTDEASLAARAPFSKPRVLPPLPPVVAPAEPLEQLVRIEALLTHHTIRPIEKRKARAYVSFHAGRVDELAKVVARLEFLIADRQKNTPPLLRRTINAIHSPAYHALYPVAC
jgi:hypothetical protein